LQLDVELEPVATGEVYKISKGTAFEYNTCKIETERDIKYIFYRTICDFLFCFTASTPSKTLFVRGLTEDFDKSTLLSNFDGSVDARIPVDRESGRNKP